MNTEHKVKTTKVAVVGPNGNLGKYVVPALVAAGFEITLVTRTASKAEELKRSIIVQGGGGGGDTADTANSDDAKDGAVVVIHVVQGDYTSAASLAKSLKGHDSVVSLLNRDQTAAQIQLVDAVLAAGVPHIVPAAFGVDTSRPEVRALPHLAVAYVKSEDHLRDAIERADGATTFTGIHNGAFLEWIFKFNYVINLVGKGDEDEPSTIFDQGDVRMSASSMWDIGKAVAVAVARRNEVAFRNKFLLMHNVTFSQNELLGYAKDTLPDKPWPIVRVDTLEAERKSQEEFDSGNRAPVAMHGFFQRAFFGKGLGFFPETDNALLGVEEHDGEWLKDMVRTQLV
ncbi:hypothetical protein LTS17_010787 [Exophiala oligosperma]